MKHRRFGFPVPIDDTCVLYMPFEDNFGTDYLDRSNHANHGTRVGAVQCNGIDNLGLSFDGINDYLAVADSVSLDCSAVSIAAWVKLDPTWDDEGYILVKCEDWNVQFSYGLQISTARALRLWIASDGTNRSGKTSTPTISIDEWHHVVGTFEETIPPAAGTYLLYIDGAVVAGAGGIRPSIHIGTGRVTIGARWATNTTAEEFNGLLDDVLVFNCALSAQEINDLYMVDAGDNTRE